MLEFAPVILNNPVIEGWGYVEIIEWCKCYRVWYLWATWLANTCRSIKGIYINCPQTCFSCPVPSSIHLISDSKISSWYISLCNSRSLVHSGSNTTDWIFVTYVNVEQIYLHPLNYVYIHTRGIGFILCTIQVRSGCHNINAVRLSMRTSLVFPQRMALRYLLGCGSEALWHGPCLLWQAAWRKVLPYGHAYATYVR